MSQARSGLLAGIGPVGELMLAAPDAGGDFTTASLLDPETGVPPAGLSEAPTSYAWPTWNASAGTLFVSTVESGRKGKPAARVLRYDLKNRAPAVIYENPPGTSSMGPGLPHYLNPSPDGRHVLVLTQAASSGLALFFVDAAGRGPGRPIGRGAPLFSAWSASSDAVLLHAGGELSLMELSTAPSTELFATNHVGYRVPAWSPDGRSFAVTTGDGRKHSLVVYDREGHITGSLAPSWGSAAFVWSPDGELIAQAQSRRGQPQRYVDLQLVGTSSHGVRPLRVRECCAFVWSPTSEYLAVLVPDSSGKRVAWTVVARDGSVVRRFPAFQPSPEFSIYMAFFDQYLLSHSLWSADGTWLLGFGRLPYDGVPPELLPSSVYVFHIASGTTRSIAPGGVAFWSPRTG